MALGGGKWITQNKILPGAYINFVSTAKADATLSDRGIATIPVSLDWGPDNDVFKVDSGDFFTNSTAIFGYPYTSEKLTEIREIFKRATTVYFYRLNSGTKAANTLATARYSGVRGNDLKVIVSKDIDEEDLFIVETVLGATTMDVQAAKTIDDLEDNDFLIWKSDATLEETASMPLEKGTNVDDVTGEDYQKYLDKIDGYSFNVMGCPTDDDKVIDLFVQYTKRMRDEVGALFQTVVYSKDEDKHDHEGIIVLENECTTEGMSEFAGIYWLTGAEAGCSVNKSLDNENYDGELDFYVDYKQSELIELIEEGKLVLHRQGDDVRVLVDINSFVTFTDEKSKDFSNNQTMRILDEKGNAIALIFNNKYNGHVPNDKAGRESFWSDMISINRDLEQIRAIQNYDDDNLIVTKGKDKGSVYMEDTIEPINAMRQLYSVIYVK